MPACFSLDVIANSGRFLPLLIESTESGGVRLQSVPELSIVGHDYESLTAVRGRRARRRGARSGAECADSLARAITL